MHHCLFIGQIIKNYTMSVQISSVTSLWTRLNWQVYYADSSCHCWGTVSGL